MTMALNTKKLTWEIEKAGHKVPTQIRKRDGSISAFDPKRIASAVDACLTATDVTTISGAEVASKVVRVISAKYRNAIPTVEQVQDAVSDLLYSLGEIIAADAYKAYRTLHKNEREARPIPEEVKAAFEEDKQYFPTASQQFMYYDKYSRYNHEIGRRETWRETIDRNVNHLKWLVNENAPHAMSALDDENVFERVYHNILTMQTMPSMRMLAMAGEAAQRNGIAIYNCGYAPIKDMQVFVEALLISMGGCGFGYSVEKQYVEQIPRVARQKRNQQKSVHEVEDTTEGWGEALRIGLEYWMTGRDIDFDFDFVRPKGSVLMTKGGRASGPEPLMEMLSFVRNRILSRQGKFLRSVDCHFMMCAVGKAAESGGVRRTALACIFDRDDIEMRKVKSGDFDSILWNANNSTVWHDDITELDVIEQMTEMMRAGTGEPGIFSRANANNTIPERRKTGQYYDFGTNPCFEIYLRPYQFCNLSIAVVRPEDTYDDLKNKVEIASIIGTLQSLTINFPGLRPEWKQNCEEERLLGVDLAGQMDHLILQQLDGVGEEWRESLKNHAVAVNKKWADILGINPAAAVTCTKPSGNSSELLGIASGIHARHSKFYRRNMRISASSPLFKVLRSAGVPMDPENGQTAENATSWVIHFLKKSPEGAITKEDRTAVEQCEFWLINKKYWTEHNPSVTVSYKEHEIVDLIKWVVDHKDQIGGMSFLPWDNTVYSQMPYETLTEEEYLTELDKFPNSVDYSKLYRYELEDYTTAAQELSCFAGQCLI